MPNVLAPIRAAVTARYPEAQVVERQRASIKHRVSDAPDGRRRFVLDASIGPLHYRDAQGQQREINTDLVLSSRSIVGFGTPAYEMVENEYEMFVLGELNSGVPLVRYQAKNTGYYVQFAPHNLVWTNDLNQIELISIPNTTSTVASGTESKWEGAYGAGLDLRFIAGAGRMGKWLDIASQLPTPAQYIVDGGNPVIEFAEILSFHNELAVYVNGQEWNKTDEVATAQEIEFRSPDGQVQFVFPVAKAHSDDPEVVGATGELRLKKQGPRLYVTVRFPLSWLETATYPVHLDTTIDKQTAAGADDGCSWYYNGTTFDNTSEYMYAGAVIGGYQDLFSRFEGITGLSGATIGVAYIELYEFSSSAGALTKVQAEFAAAPTQIGSTVDHAGRTRTSAGVDWDGDLVPGWNESPSIVSVIQEIADNFDPTVIQILDDDDGSSQLGTNRHLVRTYEYSDQTYGMKLHIEYSGAGNGNGEVEAEIPGEVPAGHVRALAGDKVSPFGPIG